MGRREQIEANRKRKLELSEELAISREAVGMSRALVKESLNVKRKVLRSVQKNQTKVAVGSAIVGLVASMLLRSKKAQPEKKKSLGGWIKGMVVAFAIKKAKGKVVEKAKHMLIQKIQRNQQS